MIKTAILDQALGLIATSPDLTTRVDLVAVPTQVVAAIMKVALAPALAAAVGAVAAIAVLTVEGKRKRRRAKKMR